MTVSLALSYERYPFLQDVSIHGINPSACAGLDDWSGIKERQLLDVVTPPKESNPVNHEGIMNGK